MLILAIGDLHIPYRTTSFPTKFKKLLTPGKISQVLCLGNSTTTSNETYEYLKQLSPDFQQVKGQFDSNSQLPLSLVVTHGNWRIGFTNGFNIVPENDPLSLLTLARQMNVDVLIWGGESGKVEAYGLEGKFFVNPGSATGAMGLVWEDIEEDDDQEDEGEVKDDKEQAESTQDNKEETSKKVEKDETTKDEGKTENNEDQTPLKEELQDEDDVFAEDELYDTIPSFTLLDIQGKAITLYIYTYINGEVKVDKVNYKKEE